MEIGAATLTALYLFDVAEHIDLAGLRQIIGTASEARLTSKAAASAYLRYHTPPLVADGETLGFTAIDGFRTRLKFFDYGVISLALTRTFRGSWADLVESSHRYIENASLEAQSDAAVRTILERCQAAVTRARATFLSEDYLVVAVHQLEGAGLASELVDAHGGQIAQLLRGEAQPLSSQEQEEVLRVRLSYLATDLVVPTWNAAFVYDTEPGAAATLELLEFANSQLLEFRYHDALLDAELARIYPQLQRTSWWNNLMGRGTARAATQLHSLFIDINEITDRTENALKIVGDIYAARLLALVSARLGIARWKASVKDKLETLDGIYRFAVEQVAISRGQFLELTVVLILILELVLFMIGVMK
ncbi:MAG TPA: hypothetical protein VFT39_16325 [Vicinamibacterales bacterium]|nr:hypothetical protein [Vicinamibacterales bacterium]